MTDQDDLDTRIRNARTTSNLAIAAVVLCLASSFITCAIPAVIPVSAYGFHLARRALSGPDDAVVAAWAVPARALHLACALWAIAMIMLFMAILTLYGGIIAAVVAAEYGL